MKLKSGYFVGIILTESNYDVWSQLVEMHIANGKNFPTFEVVMKDPRTLQHTGNPLNDNGCTSFLLDWMVTLSKFEERFYSDRSTQNWQDQSKTNHPKTTLILISQPSNALTAIRLVIPRVVALKLWDIQTEANVVEKASALVAATIMVSHPLDLPHKKLFTANDYNLLSVSQITATLSCIVIFWPEFYVFKDIQTRQTIGCGIKRGKLYYLDLQSKDSNKLRQALMADGSEGEKKKSEIWLWHRRLGHASFGYLKKLFPSLFAKSDISGFRCDICELAKSHRASFPLILNKSLSFMVIHSDVWGPSKVPTLSGSRWFVTFIDDCTRMTWLCLMKTKDEVNLLFQKFHKMIETQYNAKVRVLRSDNGGEYQSYDLQKYLEGHGIIHQTTCSNTPQQNGVVEQKNHTC
ncbi:Retrovirus-related Pol polyprotein from transposon TNT 1-94 [Vitis vinifera]|uniref:Retrovirus-related Pol polyprotein from transposon TNT 1-94 n=1 Tax=Vitis vinifera TaxID=29760 RepID=A0A438DJN7_VITVI|nr:Retrovirus-related Pol polyprotein from transposon TNT 1-94 [Vitis vinifera]